ncbi:hypothetical protein [Thiohalophilus thiocyanatoxydans]|uniref:DUF4124 domain-containing protein n=1 Tax=Thiohalophilus thiocyanatoxydans TaxID=381308 RepID=A0A4R8ISW2_9GAMM|nr:hypothetical protein [Thiohalophilus thiocyanatoxydans]TDY04132.1 hypothetical protein EDC23_0504 [Thiohalophilus thiocyanatoxydans]
MLSESRLVTRLCLLGLLGAFAPATLAEAYKCWTNEDGIRECGESVPPEYSQQRIEILNRHGVVIDIEEPARTPAQLEQEKRASKQRESEAQQKKEKRRQDHILLSTFTTERDLKLYHQDKRESIEGQVEITRSSNQAHQENLKALKKRAANLERRGEPLPDNLLEKMEQLKRQIANNERFIANKQQELERLNEQYKTRLKRYRELTSSD